MKKYNYRAILSLPSVRMFNWTTLSKNSSIVIVFLKRCRLLLLRSTHQIENLTKHKMKIDFWTSVRFKKMSKRTLYACQVSNEQISYALVTRVREIERFLSFAENNSLNLLSFEVHLIRTANESETTLNLCTWNNFYSFIVWKIVNKMAVCERMWLSFVVFFYDDYLFEHFSLKKENKVQKDPNKLSKRTQAHLSSTSTWPLDRRQYSF